MKTKTKKKNKKKISKVLFSKVARVASLATTVVASEILTSEKAEASITIGETAGSPNNQSVKKTSAAAVSTAIAIGNNANASNSGSAFAIAIGGDTTSTGNGAISIGKDAQSLASSGVAVGYNSKASGGQAVAIGGNIQNAGGAQATGDQSISIGGDTIASGSSSIAIGGDDLNQANSIAGVVFKNLTGVDLIGTTTYVKTESGGAGSIAIGVQSTSSGHLSTAFGTKTKASGAYSTALGVGASSEGEGSIALGGAASSKGKTSIAIGTKVKTVGESATSMGYGAEANSKGAVAIGLDSRAGDGNAATGTAGVNGINAVAIGTGAKAIAKNTISIGTGNVVSGVGSGAIGDPTTITGAGTYSLGNDNGTIAASNSGVFGNNNNIKGATSGNRVIGNNNTVEVTANNALIFGNNAGVSAANGIAIGENSASTSEGSIAFGLNSKAGNGSGATFGLAKDAIAIGTNSSARGDKAVAIGKGTQANHDSNIAIGNSAETGRDLTVSNYDIKNISIGYEAGKGMNGQFNSYLGTNAGQDSKGDGNSAFGLRAGKTVTGNTNTAIGMDSGQNVKASSNTAIGLNAGQNVTANGGGSNVAIGTNAGQNVTTTSLGGGDNIAIGTNAGRNVTSSIGHNTAVGHSAGQNITGTNNVAFGSGSGQNVIGDNNTSMGINAGIGVKSSSNVSIGSDSGQNTDGVGNTAIGYQAGQKVTGGHNISMGYQSAKGLNGGSNTIIGFQAGQEIVGGNNIIVGTNATKKVTVDNVVSIGTNSTASTNNSVAVGSYSKATGNAAIAIGQGSNASKDNSMAIGNRSTVNAAKDVAIGSDSSTSATTGVSKATITVPGTGKSIIYGTFAGSNPDAAFSVGSAGKERQIQNVAAGRVTATSTDAINGSQLFAVANELGKTWKANAGGNLSGSATSTQVMPGDEVQFVAGKNLEVEQNLATGSQKYTYSLKKDVDLGSTGSLKVGPVTINNNGIDAGNKKITNVAPGTADTDAANVSQVKAAKTTVSSDDNSITVTETTKPDGHKNYDLSVDVTKLDAANKSLSNINNAGNKVISDIARKSVDVVAGTNIKNIVKNDVQNSDGTTTTTYTINANGARVVAGDGVTVATGTPGSNNITDYTVSVKNTTLTAAPGSTTVTAGDNNSYAKAGDVATAITNAAKAAKTEVKSPDSSINVATDNTSPDGHTIYNITIDKSGKVAAGDTKLVTGDTVNTAITNAKTDLINNNPLKFGGDSGTVVTRKLGDQLDIKGGATGATTSGNIAVIADGNNTLNIQLAKNLTGLDSISTNGGNTVINDNGITTPSLTLTNSTPLTSSSGGKVTVPAGTGNQAVTGQTVANAINKLGDNTINLKASDGNITTKQSLNKDGGLEFNITGSNGITTTASGDTINVTIAQSGLNTSTTGGKTTVTPVTGGNTYATAGDVATAIQNAVNNSGWNAVAGSTGTGTTSGSVSNKLITPGETVKLQAGDNLNVDQSGGTFTYSLKKDISLDSVTTGDTKVANGGITIGTGSNQVALTNNGLNNGGNKITNVAAGTNKNDAVNVGQLNAAKTELENGTNTTVSSRTGSNGQTIYKVNTDFTSIADAIGGNTKFDPTTGKIDTSAANIGGTGQTNISDAVKAAITTVSSNDASVTVNKVQKSDGHYNYDLSVDTNKIAANTNLTYKANSGTGLTTTLANGLDFKDGDNTKATVGPNGEVKYSLNPTVAGINSITTNGGNTVINDNGIITPKVTINNAPTAGTDATNKDYVDSTKTKVTSNDSSVVINKTTSGNQDVYDLSVDVTKLDAANKSLSNINNAGNKVISDIARKSVDVVAGTNIKNIVKNDVQNSDGTTTTTYTINANGARVVAGDGVTVATGTPGSNNITDYTVSVKNTTLTAAPGSTTVTAGDNNSYAKAGDVATAITNAAKAAKTEVKSPDSSINVATDNTSPDGHTIYNITIDKSGKVAAGDTKLVTGDTVNTAITNAKTDLINNNPLKFGGDSGTVVTRKLGDQLDIKGGATGATTSGNIAVIADGNNTLNIQLAKNLTGLDSISTNGGNTVINDNGITTPSLTLTNSTPLTSSSGGKVTVPAGTGNQAVTGQTVANAINKLGDNTINLKASDGNITTKQSLNKDGGLEFNITGSNGITTTASGDTINVTIAQSGLNTSTTGGKTTVTPVTGGNTYATAGDVATAIQNAVNNSGWNAVAGSTGTGTTSGSVSNKLITPGETVKLQAGDNLNVDQSGGTFTYSLKNDINVNSITAGNNKFDTSGLTISDAAGNKAITTPSGTTYTNAAGNTTVINPTGVVINKSAADPSKSVSLTDNGLDNGGNKITNVAAGVNPTDAVNVSQLDKAINKSTYNGPVVYTNAAGEKIVKVNGNYYKASDVDVNGNLLPGAVAINPSDIQHSLLNADGSTTNPSTLDNVGKGKISSSSKQAINGSQLNNLGTQLGLTVDPSGTGFSNPTFAGLKNVNGSTGAAPTTFKDAVDQTIAKVNEGIIYGADNNTAGTRQQLGSRLTVESGDFASGGVNYKGQNLETSYVSDGAGNGKIIVGITENPEFNSVKAKTFTADDGAGNTTVTNGQGTTITDAAGNKNVATAAGNTYTNAAGNTTTVNSSGVTINKSAADPSKSVSLTNSGLDNGGNRITNIAAGVAPTDAVNVSQLGNAVNNLTTAINASKSEVVGGTNTNVTSSTGSNGQIVYKVDADGTTVSGGSSFVSVTQGTKDANNITDYKVDLAQGTKDKLNSIGTGNIAAGDNNTVTGSTVHNYIQNNPLTYTDDNGTTVTRNLGQNLNIMGRATGPLTTGNIGVVAAGPDTLELRLAENVDLGPNGRVTIGKTVVNDDGIKITGGPSVTSSGIDAGGKKVTNIAEGDISPTSNDAVTGRQVYNAISAGAADKATRAELAGVNNNLTAGIAGVAAMANLPQINDSASNRFNIAVAGGAYKNGRAMALGFSGVSDGGRFVYRASASLNNKRDVAVGLGVGYQFGKRDVMPNELDRMKSMVALIEEQKDSYSRQLKQQLEQESRKNQENSELIRQLMQEVQELKSKSNVSNRSNRS